MNNSFLRGSIQGQGNVMGLNRPIPQNNPKENKKDDITKIVTHCADKSGCAHYRMIWPNYVLNSAKEYIIADFKRPVLDVGWYEGVDVIRMQRQVSSTQRQLFGKLRQIADKYDIRLIYELDDIPLYEDIPLYNKNRNSYARDDFRQNIIEMMNMSDEVTVSTNFMKKYFLDKISNTKITHVPNYMPRFWTDRYYDEEQLKVNFSKNKKKPRILYAGSASHYAQSSNVEDDFSKLVPYVLKTMKDYQWVFFGGLPRELIPYYKQGKIEFHNYSPVVNYNETFKNIKANISIAPLLKNNFNRAKSHIKLTEAAAFGMPCICQSEIEPYEEAIYTFDTPSELDDQIKKLTKDSGEYMKACRKSRMIANNHWLEDNIDVWDELYRLPYQDEKRVNLNKINDR
jgi:glycosyltransferase involved in cell wall biosynthesis